MRMVILVALAGVVLGVSTCNAQPAAAPAFGEIVIDGTLTDADRLSWIERPFTVPAGVARIDVETSYTDRDRGTAIEFGVYDPERFRGASRTSKSRFFIARDMATASYRPGPIQAGTWRMLLGVPSIRRGSTSTYRIRIQFTPEASHVPSPVTVSREAAASGPRWYQGDPHTHTMHSDGYECVDGTGAQAPCLPAAVADAAARRGLDFLGIADHNTTSHHAMLPDLQARYPRMLFLRAQEITTFYGHALALGTSDVIDFRIGHPGVTANEVFRQAHAAGAIVSLNHPGRETGEQCTGCGWNAPGTDYALVDAIEAVNGMTVSGPTAGEPFWHARLGEGRRVTGIGGSDDHGATARAGFAVGTPTTVVYAEALTEDALLAGIRAGHVYIKTRGPEGPDVRLTVPASGAMMGDIVRLSEGSGSSAPMRMRIAVTGGKGQRVDVIRRGSIVADAVPAPLASNDETFEVDVAVERGDWVRVNLRDDAGITVMTNPIYVR